MIGQTIAHYEILDKLGEGGMGVVYKARDTHLDRFVAIKVLLAERVADPERKRRFVQEAKAASALNHPNIITIHDIASDGGRDFIVMEYVAGRTLEQFIGRKGLKLNETLKCGIQMADALAVAHAAGIVHRDLKPGNVMVTGAPSGPGLVKVLDFGLAKLTEAGGGELAPTETLKPHTEEGTILGTVAYMSPEQAEGKTVDARSDIFSFGAVLYEMVTGRRAFQRDSRLSTLAAILREEPKPATQVAVETPRDLEKIISRCLRKDPTRRYQHMDDVKLALEELKEESDSGALVSATPLPGARGRRWLLPAVIAAAVLLVAAAVGISLWLTRSQPPTQGPVLTRLTFDSGLTTDPALSPDGKLLACASDRSGEGNLDIWVQQVAGGEPIRLTRDPADDSEPVFSPDGSKIAFRSERAGGGIYVVSALGGDARLIAKDGRSPRFSPDGNEVAYYVGNPTSGVAYARGSARIYVVGSAGGPPRQLEPKFEVAFSPAWTADGKHVVFGGLPESTAGGKGLDFWVTSLDGGPAVKTGTAGALAKQGLTGIYSSYPGLCPAEKNRFILPARLGDSVNLWQIALSGKTWQIEGPAQRLTFGAGLEVQPSAAAGRLVFASLTESSNIWSLPVEASQGKTSGVIQQITRGAVMDEVPAVSANGKQLVFLSNRSGSRQLWIKDLETGRETALTATQHVLHLPIIAPDGSKVAYRELVGQQGTTYIVSSSGGVAEKVCEDCQMLFDWSADGRKILYSRTGNRAVGLLELASGVKVELVRHPEYNLWQAQFSPAGRWISFLARIDAAHKRIYIVPFREGAAIPLAEWIPVTDGQSDDDKPRWSPDGNLMYFTSERDGFCCIWAQPLDPATKRPVRSPFALYHSHSPQRSLMNLGQYPLEMSVTRNALIFNLGERTGNLWMARLN